MISFNIFIKFGKCLLKLHAFIAWEKGKDDKKWILIILNFSVITKISILGYKDKMDILKTQKQLIGTGYDINEDFSNETMTIRK